ncbi:MAG: hypothetical protein BWZ02_01767 [Lentisphaerae bacterium ADurb.BinA184]|nr:MAG: hypothetical protein BWZ02_01767 [Lentisphaerae bacterium ADurb.BinA184]
MTVDNHYFLVSSLPLVRLGSAPPFTPEAFDALCRPHLTSAQAAGLEAVSLLPNGRPCCDADRRWQAWETYLRNLLARARAARAGEHPQEHLRHEDDVFPAVRRQVEDALTAANPAARERALDELRWRRLDDCGAPPHQFDFDALVVYRLRLLLAARWAAPRPADGRERLDRLARRAVEQARAARRVAQAEADEGHPH